MCLQHASTLCNRHVSVKSRLKLFDSVITPVILFGLAVLPLTQGSLQQILGTQKKMLRKIVGWVRIPDEPWELTMRRMKVRVENALLQYPIMWWTRRIAESLWKFAVRIKNAPVESWIYKSTIWKPEVINDPHCEFVAYRCVGRPRKKWDDVLTNFCRARFNLNWRQVSIETFGVSMNDFIAFHCGFATEKSS